MGMGNFWGCASQGTDDCFDFFFFFLNMRKKIFIWASSRVLRSCIKVSGYSWIRIMICVIGIL